MMLCYYWNEFASADLHDQFKFIDAIRYSIQILTIPHWIVVFVSVLLGEKLFVVFIENIVLYCL